MKTLLSLILASMIGTTTLASQSGSNANCEQKTKVSLFAKTNSNDTKTAKPVIYDSEPGDGKH